MKRLAYRLVTLAFVASVICSIYALMQVKRLQTEMYQAYTPQQRADVQAQSRRWMILGVASMSVAILTFIGLAVMPAALQLGGAVKKHQQFRAPPP